MGGPQDVTFQRPKDVGRERPQGVGTGHPLALHRGPYRDVHRTLFGEVLRTSSGRNFAEWVRCREKINIRPLDTINEILTATGVQQNSKKKLTFIYS